MAKRTFELQSRNIFCGPEQRKFGELFDVACQCDFADDADQENDFTIVIKADGKRWLESSEYFTNQQYMGDLSETDRINVRHNIQIAPQVGFYGSYFNYTVTKKIPSTGIFNWYGVTMNVLPLNVDQEFMMTLDTITVGF